MQRRSYCSECSGMGCEGVDSLVANLPVCEGVGGSQLSKLDLSRCGINDEGAKMLAAMLRRCLEQVWPIIISCSILRTNNGRLSQDEYFPI